MIIKIGKAEDNDVVIDDPSVSRNHATLSSSALSEWTLEDLDSTNGTFVNDQQILKKKINDTDRIRFGANKEYRLNDLLHANNDYSEEFEKLKPVYKSYIEAKIKIQSSNQLKTRLLQSLPFAIPGVIGVFISFIGKKGTEFLGVSLIVAIIAPTIGIYMGAKQSAKTPKLLQTIADDFKIRYVCPKCGAFLGEIPWESLANKKRCPACKAKWVKE
jgi:rubredoxin